MLSCFSAVFDNGKQLSDSLLASKDKEALSKVICS